MPIKQFEYTTMEGRRHSKKWPKSLNIEHNISYHMVGQPRNNEVPIEFTHTITFGPIGMVHMQGSAIYFDPKGEIIGKVEDANLPEEADKDIRTAILDHGVYEAIVVCRKLKLPPPALIQIPMKGQGGAPGKKKVVTYGPEVA